MKFVLALALISPVSSSQVCFAGDFQSDFKYRQSQHRWKMQEAHKRFEESRKRMQESRNAPSIHTSRSSSFAGSSSRHSVSNQSGRSGGAPPIVADQKDFQLPLYPGSPHYTSVGRTSQNGGMTVQKYMKFWTRDGVSSVYAHYVRALQSQGWRISKKSTGSEIVAYLPSKKLAVSIKYKPLPAPYSGSAVALGQAWRKGSAPTRIVSMVNPDMSERGLDRWWNGN